MTTFVPLAADTDGTVSAVAVGEWILQVMKGLCTAQETQAYYHAYVEHFEQDPATKEQRMKNPLALFKALLHQHHLVFRYLREAKEKGEGVVVGGGGDNQLKKNYAEVMREVEEFFTFLMSLIVLRIERNEDAGTAARGMVEAIQSGDDMVELRLRLLQSLYNVFPPNFPFRVPIFINILQFAAKSNLFHLMLPYIDYIDEWMADWHLTADSKREVFLVLAMELKKLGKTKEAHLHLKRHVELFQGESHALLLNSSGAAVELVELSLRLPDVCHFDSLLELHCVKALADTEHSSLVELLEIFVRKGPLQLSKFREDNPNIFEQHNLEYDDCLQKIKLLAVASICTKKREVPLSQISDELNISDSEAEEVVVQSIGKKIVDAKIDQMRRVVHVTSAMQREFKRPQWEELRSKLDRWSESVKTILSAVHTSKTLPLQYHHIGGVGVNTNNTNNITGGENNNNIGYYQQQFRKDFNNKNVGNNTLVESHMFNRHPNVSYQEEEAENKNDVVNNNMMINNQSQPQ